METRASFWACDLSDLSDLGERSSVCESPCVFPSSSAGLMWTQQISPHLQRNKQLQDTLLQREEELVRLQDENNQLREFLASSFVNLERKAKKLPTDGRRLKRSLAYSDDGSLHDLVPHLQTSQRVSKRVCRNLTAEFCSSSSDTSTCSQPNLDLWVLRTLGLKDRDTIDTSSGSSAPPGFGLCGLRSTYHAAESPSSDYTLRSVSTATPSSVHVGGRSPSRQTDHMCSAAGRREAQRGDPARSPQTCSTAPGQRAGIGFYGTSTALRSSSTAEQPPNTQTRFTTASSQVQSLERDPTGPPAYRSPSSRDSIQSGPPFSCVSSSSPGVNWLWMSGGGGVGGATVPLVGSLPPATPCCRKDLAFSMSLSPSSSVKTISFTHGQAFVRKDTEGRCNFTWVPTQRV
ncbi:geminin coiled-coil domain-containing protein 1 [Pungitius pungitius]|uniref:geminin coiled-coil domain-containing protein 1 n=1 Tax=Pungitius pungitius TaxID=134920 RepID=UPI002E0FC243